MELWRRLAAGGWRLLVVVVVFSHHKVLQRLVEQIIVDLSGPGQGSTALRGAEPRGVGLGAPFSDVTVYRTASLRTWTLFLRARNCDTLPTCHATVYRDFWKNS